MNETETKMIDFYQMYIAGFKYFAILKMVQNAWRKVYTNYDGKTPNNKSGMVLNHRNYFYLI